MVLESGPHEKRPACITYNRYIQSVGGRVRGGKGNEGSQLAKALLAESASTSIKGRGRRQGNGEGWVTTNPEAGNLETIGVVIGSKELGGSASDEELAEHEWWRDGAEPSSPRHIGLRDVDWGAECRDLARAIASASRKAYAAATPVVVAAAATTQSAARKCLLDQSKRCGAAAREMQRLPPNADSRQAASALGAAARVYVFPPPEPSSLQTPSAPPSPPAEKSSLETSMNMTGRRMNNASRRPIAKEGVFKFLHAERSIANPQHALSYVTHTVESVHDLEPPEEILDAAFPPLQLLDLHDSQEISRLHALLHLAAMPIFDLLHLHTFPQTMEFQPHKLSASGQDLGGSILIPLRLGFSGTPSSLLPLEMGKCRFAQGVEAQILSTMTNPSIVSFFPLMSGWCCESLLKLVAQAEPPYAALIDTGALITGYSNKQVRVAGTESADGAHLSLPIFYV
eukprot:scaffold25495_cov30-Tisochrysis_lutea.AAC.5